MALAMPSRSSSWTRSFMSMVPNAAPRRYVCSGVGRIAADVLGARCRPRIARSRSCLRLVDPLAHPAERAELARAGERGALAVDLEVLEAVVAHADADRAVAIGGLEVGLPQIGRLEDVAVAVDHERSVVIASSSARWKFTATADRGPPLVRSVRPGLAYLAPGAGRGRPRALARHRRPLALELAWPRVLGSTCAADPLTVTSIGRCGYLPRSGAPTENYALGGAATERLVMPRLAR